MKPNSIALFACWTIACTTGFAAEVSRPNIVLVMTDDQGYGPLGRHGNLWIQTPNLDALYDKSTRFIRFLVSPTCSPTRSAIMTGRHPMKNGITHTILERERMTLKANTLPQVLKTAGYRSGIFGKWHLGDEDEYQPNRRGFDETFIHGAGGIGQAYDCSCADAPQNKYFDPVIRHNGSFVKTSGFCTDVFFTAALGWIKERQATGEPFFAYIATNAPHSPYLAPEKNVKRFKELGFGDDAAGFYGMVENIDENIGRLMDRLSEWKLLDNTLVIFMSDNGTAGGVGGAAGARGKGKANNVLGKSPDGKAIEAWNAGMKGLKGSPDEGGVRVPFFVRWDGHFKPGRDIDRIAAHVDILPTLAELVGATLPANQVEGRSLLPLLKDETALASWQDRYLFTHTGRWPVGTDPDEFKTRGFAVRNQQFRLVGEELFDLQADPGQSTSVMAQHPEVAKNMLADFDRFWSEARPLMVNESAVQSPTRPYWVAYEAQKTGTGIPNWKPPKL